MNPLPKTASQLESALAESDAFFVYGTLLRPFANYQRYLKNFIASITPAYCPGQLYHLPEGYPGLIPADGPQPDLAAGELMSFRDPLKILSQLDSLEDFDPAHPESSLYLRRLQQVLVCDSQGRIQERVRAWVYEYSAEQLAGTKSKVRVECGNWRAFHSRVDPDGPALRRYRLDSGAQQLVEVDCRSHHAEDFLRCQFRCQSRQICGYLSDSCTKQ